MNTEVKETNVSQSQKEQKNLFKKQFMDLPLEAKKLVNEVNIISGIYMLITEGRFQGGKAKPAWVALKYLKKKHGELIDKMEATPEIMALDQYRASVETAKEMRASELVDKEMEVELEKISEL